MYFFSFYATDINKYQALAYFCIKILSLRDIALQKLSEKCTLKALFRMSQIGEKVFLSQTVFEEYMEQREFSYTLCREINW